MNAANLSAIWITIQLATVTTVILFLIGAPVAWWLARTQAKGKAVVEALTTLPLVLPPTVLGFYFLLLFNPYAPLGSFFVGITGQTLTFTFHGLVLASVIYSMPFMIQPLKVAFEQLDQELLETARVLGANTWATILSVILPSSVRGILTALVLTFAHTVGEFGVVLMIGGNIPGKTRVVSIAIYENVETLNYADAHLLAGGLLVFSFITLVFVYSWNRRTRIGVS